MEVEQFAEAIIANPNDVEARLVFADFLEEQNDPRSELVRLQFRMADMSKYDRVWPKLRQRERELIREHGCFGEVPKVVKVIDTMGGFVDAIELTVARYLKHQTEIFSAAPIRSVTLVSKSTRFDQVRLSPHLAQLVSLTLKSNHVTEEQLTGLLSEGNFDNLRSLDVRGCTLSDDFARVLTTLPTLASIEELAIDGFNVRTQLSDWFTNSQTLTNLKTLAVYGLNDKFLRAIVQSSNFRALESIDVSSGYDNNYGVTPDGLRALQSGPYCRNLQQLSFTTHRTVSDPISPFHVDQPLEGLKHLQYSGGNGNAVLQDICRNYPNLETLDLTNCRIDNAGIAILADHPMLERLDKLVLTNNLIGRTGIEALAESKYRNKRTRLSLRGNSISFGQANQIKEKYGKTFGNLPKLRWHYR